VEPAATSGGVGDGGQASSEPVGLVIARTSELVATDVTAAEVPNVIDELPLVLCRRQSEGRHAVARAAELRAKESDRLRAMARMLCSLGIEVVEHPDGLDVVGDPNGWEGGSIETEGDHRVAMAGR